MTIISTTADKNPLEEMEIVIIVIIVSRRVRNAVLGVISKTTEWSLFVSEANQPFNITAIDSMPQPLMPKKLNCSMKIYTF